MYSALKSALDAMCGDELKVKNDQLGRPVLATKDGMSRNNRAVSRACGDGAMTSVMKKYLGLPDASAKDSGIVDNRDSGTAEGSESTMDAGTSAGAKKAWYKRRVYGFGTPIPWRQMSSYIKIPNASCKAQDDGSSEGAKLSPNAHS